MSFEDEVQTEKDEKLMETAEPVHRVTEKMTARQRWLWAFNKICNQVNVSEHICYFMKLEGEIIFIISNLNNRLSSMQYLLYSEGQACFFFLVLGREILCLNVESQWIFHEFSYLKLIFAFEQDLL